MNRQELQEKVRITYSSLWDVLGGGDADWTQTIPADEMDAFEDEWMQIKYLLLDCRYNK